MNTLGWPAAAAGPAFEGGRAFKVSRGTSQGDSVGPAQSGSQSMTRAVHAAAAAAATVARTDEHAPNPERRLPGPHIGGGRLLDPEASGTR
jgi:hypothetical protein